MGHATEIMVVEDEAITAMDIQQCLEKIGYHVPAIVHSGEEAVSRASELKPQLILMDVMLSGKLDGTAAAKKIAETHNIPIIFITAYRDQGTFARARKASPYGYITKPFDVHQLHFAVELAMARHQMILERERLEYQLQLNDKLSTIGTLATGVIQEMGTPLTAIVENLDQVTKSIRLLKMSGMVSPGLLDKLDTSVTECINNITRIKNTVGNLRGFARISQQEPATVNVHDLLDSSISITAPQHRENATIEKKYSDTVPLLRIYGDKLQQVFINLLLNATQAFGSQDPQKNIISISTSTSSTELFIDISDNGRGIAKETVKTLFDPFFTIRPAGIGTGVGLAICHDIIHGMGGTLEAGSTPGEGSSFLITLPLGPAVNHCSPAK